MPCIKAVVNINCQYCQGLTIKFGKAGGVQRYCCKNCKRTQLQRYIKQAYKASVNPDIAAHVKEGCGIRSIARLLKIAAGTVLKRIKIIADGIKKPAIATGKVYEVDEYALDKQSRQVVDIKVGRRTKKNLERVTDTLLMAKCKQVYTDGLDIYKQIIPLAIHKVKRYGTNRIERNNLSLRTHLNG